MRVLGIMSGTSIDGVDYALCEVTARSAKLLKFWQRNFPRALAVRLHAAATNECSAHELAQLHHDLGRHYAAACVGLDSGAELVGLHGQTVFHHPDPGAGATLQIGEPAYLVEALRVPVISNFRAADLAAGGQGAPLATLFHQLVFARRNCHVCVNNLGGISNVTSLDWRQGAEPRIRAFDTGPANVLLDLAARELSGGRKTCDRDGRWALRGKVRWDLVARWLKHPFFRVHPPKSTGRELFGEAFWRAEIKTRVRQVTKFDLAATLVEFTARSIVLNYQLHLPGFPETVVLCGGGALNAFLVERITRSLQELHASIRVVTSDTFHWHPQSIEPAAFALLAHLRWRKGAGNAPGTTGARRAVLLGQVAEP